MITRHGSEVLDEVRGLYLEMRDHHAEIAPQFGPLRTDDDAWSRRVTTYRRWLDGDDEAFVLVARDPDGTAVGYAFTHVADGMPGWREPDRLGIVETLSIAADRRGAGIGKALLDRVYAELAPLGVHTVALDVVATNTDARRFYEREGLTPRTVQYWATRPSSTSPEIGFRTQGAGS
ncbi:GNAT family N-acetyltransferase [Svornostia abyssi]|uniref:GNAT family N-acetyltransferase n=1 Tax=Svornostia abyssi TaxID=2898438 RepID=A0ABY5PJR9_9ACTN|nr:GNAT family N-acetyltransferase [Parviterribacteraceae bacterium J379]